MFTYGSAEQPDKVVPILKAHRTRCLADEPGTLEFEFSLANDDNSKVTFYEVYKDRGAFEVHWNGASVNQAVAESEAQGIELIATEGAHGTRVD